MDELEQASVRHGGLYRGSLAVAGVEDTRDQWQEMRMERWTRTKMQKASLHAVEFRFSPEVTAEPLNLGIDEEVVERQS